MTTSIEEIEKYVKENIKLITFDSYSNVLEKTTIFLMVVSTLSNFKKELELKKTKIDTIKEAIWAKALISSEGKTAGEKKADAATDNEYSKFKEEYDVIEANISWLKTNIEIFNNAHLTYRQISKGE